MIKRRAGAAVLAKLLAGCWLLLMSGLANAEITARDLQVVARTLGFLETPLSGTVSVGILHEPGNISSRTQAQAIANLLGDGLRVGNLQLTPLLVPLNEVANVNVDFFLLTEFLGAATAELPALLQRQQLPCITTDLEQVRGGYCVIGVQSVPKVEILVNREAARASNTRFSTVFRMMITEL